MKSKIAGAYRDTIPLRRLKAYTAKQKPRSMNEVFGDPYGTRTHVTAVKGRCLNHLTNGPKMVETARLERATSCV